MHRLEKKLNLLKIRNRNFIAAEYLHKDKIKMLKEAINLKKQNIIQKTWTYKGDVYYALPHAEGRHRATPQALDDLRRAHAETPA